MANPGLKKHTQGPLAVPKTMNQGVQPPEPITQKQDMMTAPPRTGRPVTPPVDATNGAEPILDYEPISAAQPQPDPNVPANERRIHQQQQVGGGAKENPAYERAQNDIQEKMQRRRMAQLSHPLFNQAALHDTTEINEVFHPDQEWDGLRTFTDEDYPVPDHAHTSFQPMISIKGKPDPEESEEEFDSPAYHMPGEACETCWLNNEDTHISRGMHAGGQQGHEFKPFETAPNARYSSLAESDEQFWDRQPDVIDTSADDGYIPGVGYGSYQMFDPGCETCYFNGFGAIPENMHHYPIRHPFKPFDNPPNARFSAFDTNPAAIRGEIYPTGGSHADNLTHFMDSEVQPDEDTWHAGQPMIDFKKQYNPQDPEQQLDSGWHEPGEACETCYLRRGSPWYGPEDHGPDGISSHPYKPFPKVPNERFSSANPLSPVKLAETDEEFWARQPDMDEHWIYGYPQVMDDAPCETCYLHGAGEPAYWKDSQKAHDDYLRDYGGYHPYKPMIMAKNERFSSAIQTASTVRTAETDEEFWARQPDVREGVYRGQEHVMGGNPTCETCYLQGYQSPQWLDGADAHDEQADMDYSDWVDHPYKPMTMAKNERFSSAIQVVAVVRTAETDEEFWARMDREHPGEQPQTTSFTGLSPDSHNQQFVDPDEDDVPDDEDVPDNMSLRDHARLLNTGFMRYNGNPYSAKYSHEVPRTVVTADGERAYANEGHVIEHNNRHQGPVLPTDDDPDPHPFRYQWMHTYYPAGLEDSEGLYRGYNSPDQALNAVSQLSNWGPRFPKSHELLRGYRHVSDDRPYDSGMTFPHEYTEGIAHTSAFDEARGEYLYNIDDGPNYFLRDRPPSAEGLLRERMYDIKDDPYEHYNHDPAEDAEGYLVHRPILDDSAWNHHGKPVCETCMRQGVFPPDGPEEGRHVPGADSYGAHRYNPVQDTKPGERLAAYDRQRSEWLYDIDKPDYHLLDPAPSIGADTGQQPMVQEKDLPYVDYGDGSHFVPDPGDDAPSYQYSFDGAHYHRGGPVCQHCFENGFGFHTAGGEIHNEYGDHYNYHEFKPVPDTPPGERLAKAQ